MGSQLKILEEFWFKISCADSMSLGVKNDSVKKEI